MKRLNVKLLAIVAIVFVILTGSVVVAAYFPLSWWRRLEDRRTGQPVGDGVLASASGE